MFVQGDDHVNQGFVNKWKISIYHPKKYWLYKKIRTRCPKSHFKAKVNFTHNRATSFFTTKSFIKTNWRLQWYYGIINAVSLSSVHRKKNRRKVARNVCNPSELFLQPAITNIFGHYCVAFGSLFRYRAAKQLLNNFPVSRHSKTLSGVKTKKLSLYFRARRYVDNWNVPKCKPHVKSVQSVLFSNAKSHLKTPNSCYCHYSTVRLFNTTEACHLTNKANKHRQVTVVSWHFRHNPK